MNGTLSIVGSIVVDVAGPESYGNNYGGRNGQSWRKGTMKAAPARYEISRLPCSNVNTYYRHTRLSVFYFSPAHH